jgi:NADPH-dependent glutamate synthase beta subunit-like oxidoreductase
MAVGSALSLVLLCGVTALALVLGPKLGPSYAAWHGPLTEVGGKPPAWLLVGLGLLVGPLIMAYQPGTRNAYVFHKGLQETAGEFLRRLTPEEAGRYVAIIGAGPAGLRVAELLVALNRHVSEAERRKILLLDRNPVPTGLGAYGIPPVHKQGVLKDGIVQQAQGIMHGMVGKREWHVFPHHQFLQVVESAFVRFFPHTDVGTDVSLAQMERLGLPLVIATGAQQPRLPTNEQGALVPGRHLAGIVAATSEFFRQIGTTWLSEKKGVQGLAYHGKPHTLRGKQVVMVYGGGNVASDAFMWAFRNTPPSTDVLLVYRGESHAMTNMSRPYFKPIDRALREQRAASPWFTPHDLLRGQALQARLRTPQRVVDTLVHQHLPAASRTLDTVPDGYLVEALNAVLRMPDLVLRLPHLERGSVRPDLHPVWAQVQESGGDPALPAQRPLLLLNRTLLELEYPDELRRLHRANMLGLLTVEAYLDKAGRGQVTHVLLRRHRRGTLVRDRKTGFPVLLRSNVVERDNIMRHRVTKEKLYRWTTVPSEECIELAVDLVIEAIGDLVQPLGDLEMTSWQTLKADAETGRVAGRAIWVAGQALTQKGKVRDSYVSAFETVLDMGPVLYPEAWESQRLWQVLTLSRPAPAVMTERAL